MTHGGRVARSRMRGGLVRLRPREITRLRRLLEQIERIDERGLESYVERVAALMDHLRAIIGTGR